MSLSLINFFVEVYFLSYVAQKSAIKYVCLSLFLVYSFLFFSLPPVENMCILSQVHFGVVSSVSRGEGFEVEIEMKIIQMMLSEPVSGTLNFFIIK